MRKIQISLTICVITCSLFSLKANAQKFKKSEEPFTASNGKTYHIGDTIVITSPTDFSNKFSYYYFDKKFTPQRAYYTSEHINKGQKVDNRFTKHIIRQFRIYEDGRTVAVTDKMFGYSVDLNKGLEMGEIATDKLMELYDKPEFFNEEKAFLVTLGDNIDNNDVKEYMYRFNRKEYRQNSQDEFAFNSIISSKKKELIEKAKQYDLNKTFFAYASQKFGTYDFDNNSYPIVWDGNYIHLMDDTTEDIMSKDINNERIDFSDIALYIDNTEEFSGFPLPQERARHLVNHRKASNGKIDRSIYMGVQFTVKEIANEEWLKAHDIKDMTKKILICNIKRIDLFEDKACEANYLSTVEI